MKRIQLTTKPSSQPPAEADAWVSNRTTDEPTKRLNVEVPQWLHQTIKVHCAHTGRHVSDVVRELLERQFGSEGQGASFLRSAENSNAN